MHTQEKCRGGKSMNKQELLKQLRGKLVVSCQANESNNPFNSPEDMVKMAKAAVEGGAVGFRANGPACVGAIKKAFPELPMFGIWKVETEGCDVYITPTMREIDVLNEIGCEVIAIDATDRLNCLGKKAWELIPEIKAKYPNQLIMADIATIHDARCAYKAGADIISTTLSGYTEESKETIKEGNADFELICQIRKEFPDAFINAEGRLWTREDAKRALECGADIIIIGSAITNPIKATERFVKFIAK